MGWVWAVPSQLRVITGWVGLFQGEALPLGCSLNRYRVTQGRYGWFRLLLSGSGSLWGDLGRYEVAGDHNKPTEAFMGQLRAVGGGAGGPFGAAWSPYQTVRVMTGWLRDVTGGLGLLTGDLGLLQVPYGAAEALMGQPGAIIGQFRALMGWFGAITR